MNPPEPLGGIVGITGPDGLGMGHRSERHPHPGWHPGARGWFWKRRCGKNLLRADVAGDLPGYAGFGWEGAVIAGRKGPRRKRAMVRAMVFIGNDLVVRASGGMGPGLALLMAGAGCGFRTPAPGERVPREGFDP